MDALRLFRDWSSDRGAELIEFALTFPLLLVICMGIIDFGLLFQRYEVLTNAAREGARIAVLPGGYDTLPNVTARVNQYLQGTSLGSTTVTTALATEKLTALPNGSCVTVKRVTVTFNHPYFFVGKIAKLFGSNFATKTLTASTAMRQETASGSCS